MSESQVKWEFSKKITGHSWKSYTVVPFAAIGVILFLGMALNSYEPIWYRIGMGFLAIQSLSMFFGSVRNLVSGKADLVLAVDSEAIKYLEIYPAYSFRDNVSETYKWSRISALQSDGYSLSAVSALSSGRLFLIEGLEHFGEPRQILHKIEEYSGLEVDAL